MNKQEILKKVISKLTKSSLKKSLKKELKLKDGTSYSIGTEIEIEFNEKSPSIATIQIGERTLKISVQSLHKYVSGFSKAPGDKALEKMVSDSIAKTPTGKRTEPDGYGSDGSPSWLLVLGLI